MAATGRVGVPQGDPERTYTPDEEARLTRNLHALLTGVHGGLFSSYPVNLTLLEALHRNIFREVRSHAGRSRSSDFGSEYLIFGPHRSEHRDTVWQSVGKLFDAFERELASIESAPDDERYERHALRLALKIHADLIQIHPFEDGNGRSGRAMMNVVLVRLGLRPLAIELPKQEYLAALNHYYRMGNLDPLEDLALRVYDLPDG
ncbi:MAG TPA: Fic family protein [Longimicrobium sp.]|jgi:Fic family protein